MVRIVPPLLLPRRDALGRRVVRPVLVTVGAAALFAALVVCAVGWFGADRAMHPPREHNTMALQRYTFAGITQKVSFPSRDGTPLAGWFVPGGRRASGTVILLHGYGQARVDMLPHAAYLHSAGYNVLLFDFRGSGQSGGTAVTFGINEPLDVLGAVDYLATRRDVDMRRVAVQGVSLGAVDGILAMADDQRIKTAVAESAFTSLDGMIARNFQHYIGLPAFPFAPAIVAVMERRVGGSATAVQPLAAVRRLGPRPLMIIEDQNDDINPPHSGEQLYAVAAGPKALWLVAGAGHAGAYAVDPAGYAHRVLAFYRDHL